MQMAANCTICAHDFKFPRHQSPRRTDGVQMNASASKATARRTRKRRFTALPQHQNSANARRLADARKKGPQERPQVRRIGRIRDQDQGSGDRPSFDAGNGGEQRAGVVLPRGAEHRVTSARLDNAARLHHRHLVGDVFRRRRCCGVMNR